MRVASGFHKNWRFHRGHGFVAFPSHLSTTSKGHAMTAAVLATGAADRCARRTVGTFSIDPSSTRIDVSLRQAGMPVRGCFLAAEGTIDVPDDIRSASVSVRFDATAFRSGRRRRDRRVHARLVAGDADPVVSFEAGRMEPILESFVTPDGDRPLWRLIGELTLGGVTRQVAIAIGRVRIHPDDGALEFAATTTVRCSELGLPRRGGLIGDTINVIITGRADRVLAAA